MSTAARPLTTRTLLLALLAVGLLGPLGALAPTAPARADAPQLSIRVDDGHTETTGGSTLRYAVTVTNLGGSRVRDLSVSQTVPPSTTLDSVSEGGAEKGGTVRWEVDVPAGRSVTLETSVEVERDLPPELLRLATVACAATSPKAAPVVCASDSDELPAGAAAAEQQRELDVAPDEGAAGALPGGTALAGVAGLAGLGVVVALVVLVTRRSRTRGPAARRTGDGSGESSVTEGGSADPQDRTPARAAP